MRIQNRVYPEDIASVHTSHTEQTLMDTEATFADSLLSRTLPNGARIPNLGFSVALSDNVGTDVSEALESGYRHVILDASGLKDPDVGRVVCKWLKEGRRARQELFISLVVDLSQDMGRVILRQHVIQRLQKVGCDYFDLIIVHKTANIQMNTVDNTRQRNQVLGMWRTLEKIVEERTTQALALSNFSRDEMETIISSCHIKPCVVWLDQTCRGTWRDVKDRQCHCRYRDVYLGAHIRLEGRRPEQQMDADCGSALTRLAKNYKKSITQILQRYFIQREMLVSLAAPLTSQPDAFQVLHFCLTKEDVELLSKLRL